MREIALAFSFLVFSSFAYAGVTCTDLMHDKKQSFYLRGLHLGYSLDQLGEFLGRSSRVDLFYAGSKSIVEKRNELPNLKELDILADSRISERELLDFLKISYYFAHEHYIDPQFKIELEKNIYAFYQASEFKQIYRLDGIVVGVALGKEMLVDSGSVLHIGFVGVRSENRAQSRGIKNHIRNELAEINNKMGFTARIDWFNVSSMRFFEQLGMNPIEIEVGP